MHIHVQAAADAIKFTVDQKQLEKKQTQDAEAALEAEEAAERAAPPEPEECLSCGA